MEQCVILLTFVPPDQLRLKLDHCFKQIFSKNKLDKPLVQKCRNLRENQGLEKVRGKKGLEKGENNDITMSNPTGLLGCDNIEIFWADGCGKSSTINLELGEIFDWKGSEILTIYLEKVRPD